MTRSGSAALIVLWLLLGALVVGVLAPPDGEPGLNYDEAFHGQQARDFLEPERQTTHPPSERSTRIAGRRFPLRNAAYMGALKPQLLIPEFWLFGATPHVMRLATLGTALAALLFTMLWARRVFGLEVAAAAALLLAFDPSFVFFGAREWGPFTTLLLCRCVGLYLLTAGWQARRSLPVVAGAFAMGLGVYGRADFVLIGVAAAAGLLAARGRTLWREIRERPGTTAAALVALVIGALPMLLSAIDLLTVGAGIAGRGDLGYRARVLWSTLDGSDYYRVMETGGLFESLFDVAAPGSLFGFALLLALPAAAFLAWRSRRERGRADPALVFLGVTVVVLAAAMLSLPGAVRAHHMLNLMPFGQLLVAWVLWRPARGRLARLAALAATFAIVASSARVIAETRSLLAETGGRGRYSDALDAFAEELASRPSDTAVSLDWGFHETLQFLTRDNPLEEPIWTIPGLLARGRSWRHRGDASHHYLVFAPRYDLFRLGPGFLTAVRVQAGRHAETREHRDREGEIVFYSVRFDGPHELTLGRDGFRIRFLAAGEPDG